MGNAGAPNLPCANELIDIHAAGLERCARQHKYRANPYRGPTTDAIREVGRKGVAGEGTDVLV